MSPRLRTPHAEGCERFYNLHKGERVTRALVNGLADGARSVAIEEIRRRQAEIIADFEADADSYENPYGFVRGILDRLQAVTQV